MVATETDGPVLVVTLDRREARNAVDGPTAEALAAEFERGLETIVSGEHL